MKKTTKLRNLRNKLAKLQDEALSVQAQIDELLADPEIAQAETEARQQAEEGIDGWPHYQSPTGAYSHKEFDAEERLFYKAGFQTFADVMMWMDNPAEKKPGIGAKRIENFRNDMRRQLRWDDAQEYERELNEGKHPLLAGMRVRFKDPSKEYREYSSGTFARITTNYDAQPEWVEVCEVIMTYLGRYPHDRKDGNTYCIPFAWVTELGLYEACDTVLPLSNYDEHDWLMQTANGEFTGYL